jgi:alkylation response protein AidB-like acyl-CoA dehydrogenase
MNLGLSPEQEMLKKVVADFAARELTPDYLRELDQSGRAPHELLPRMAALGFTGLPVPVEYGGTGGSTVDVTVLLESMGYASLSIASLLNRAIGFGTETLLKFGTEDQKRFFLPKVVSGEMIFAFSLTEANAGSDAAAITTRAVLDGDTFVINGAKLFTTGAGECPYLVVAVRTDPDARPRHRGISMLLVERTTPGVTCRKIEKLGMRGAGGLYEVHYDDVRVPASALLGPLHGGWKAVTATLERVRLAQAAYCVGGSQRALDDAIRYANQREQFGQPIGKFQAISHLLVDGQVETDAARLLLYRAAWLVDQAVACVKEASMANLKATETLVQVTSDCMRVYGGYGFTMEFDIQRHFRDARLFVVGDGSSQIQRNIIARLLGL